MKWYSKFRHRIRKCFGIRDNNNEHRKKETRKGDNQNSSFEKSHRKGTEYIQRSPPVQVYRDQNNFSRNSQTKYNEYHVCKGDNFNIQKTSEKNHEDYPDSLNPFTENNDDYPTQLNPFEDEYKLSHSTNSSKRADIHQSQNNVDYPHCFNPFQDKQGDNKENFDDNYPTELNPFEDEKEINYAMNGVSIKIVDKTFQHKNVTDDDKVSRIKVHSKDRKKLFFKTFFLS